jgi:hypothetical protein
MFWIRHPKPLLSTKAVAVQVVARKGAALRDMKVIIVETREPECNEDTASAQVLIAKGSEENGHS